MLVLVLVLYSDINRMCFM